jgi:CheY-like chemotaxis protein
MRGVKPLRILIVEDSVPMRRLMRTMLEDVASVVDECASGPEAVRLYFETHPDWVIMDLHMDGGDGLTATRAICTRDQAARIVIVTQFDDYGMREEAAQAGAVAYMLKENLLGVRRFVCGS